MAFKQLQRSSTLCMPDRANCIQWYPDIIQIEVLIFL